MKLPVTIDPRYHEAVIFDLDGVLTDTACSDASACAPLLEPTAALARKLQGVDVATAACSSSSHCQQILKTAGVDDLFDVCIDGTVSGGLGLAGNGDPAVRLEIISMDPRGTGGIDVECHGQVNRLTPGSTVEFVG